MPLPELSFEGVASFVEVFMSQQVTPNFHLALTGGGGFCEKARGLCLAWTLGWQEISTFGAGHGLRDFSPWTHLIRMNDTCTRP